MMELMIETQGGVMVPEGNPPRDNQDNQLWPVQDGSQEDTGGAGGNR